MISVIVPVHNSEKFLHKCVESIQNSTVKDLEIILVVNNSQDSSFDICQSLASADERIIVINTPKGGVSYARNLGLEKATGDYVTFVDSDDYIDSDMYAILLDNLVRSDSDISICGVYKEEVPRKSTEHNCRIIGTEESLEAFLAQKIEGYVVNKLFKRSRIASLRFPENYAMCEDEQFVLSTLMNAQSICISETEVYHYIQHPESVCNSGFSIKRWQMVLSKIVMEKAVENTSPHIFKRASVNVVTEAIRFALYAVDSGADLKELEKEIVQTVRKRFMHIGNITYKSIWKAYGVLLALNFSLFKTAYNIASRKKGR